MTKKEELISDISKIEKGLKSDLEEKFKISLREVLAKKQKELADLKDEKPAEKKASAPAPAKKVSAPAKKEDAKKSPKSVLDNCKEILRKHNKEKASAKSRIEKRKKQGKPAQLTPSETVKKTAQVVKAKVVDMKDKGLSASEIGKLADGIIATIKSTFAGIKSTSEKHLFLANLKKEISYLDSHLSKVAEYGGMFENGGEVDKNGLIYALQNDVSAGTIAGQTYANTYDEVAEVRHNALEILYRDGDKPYSLDNLIQLLKKAEKVDNRSFARVGRSQYEVGGALDGLMGDINAPVNNVGGTLFSSADLTSHLDFNANPMFKNGGDINRPSLELYKKELQQLKMQRANAITDIDKFRIDKKIREVSNIIEHRGMMAQGGLADYYEKKKYSYKEGGLTDENTEMLMSQIKEIKHHAEEIENLINNNTSVEAWVVAKAERSATDLSDITHYIDGKKETFAEGGEIKWQDVNIGDSANVKAENKTGVIVHTYGRKFNVKFVDGTEKTYDASELEFIKDDEDMFKDGGRFNTGRAWTLDHYQHNDSESYEVPTKDRVYDNGGEIDEKGMIYALQNHISSGSLANYTNYQEYSDIDNLRGTALEILYKNGDMPYSLDNLKMIIKQAEELKEQRGYAQGGRFNTGRAWTLDHYQHNDSESYEVPTNDRKYDNGGSVNKNLFLGDVLEFDGKKYKAVLGENGMVNFIDIATKDIIKTTNILWDVLYNEGVKVKHFSDSFEHGGDTDDSKKKELREILSKDYETFVELLGENIKDPKFRHTVLELAKENKIKTKVINVECEKLRPTQNEISLEKSLLFPLKSPTDADKYLKADHPIKIKNATILTCDNGEYIIDGHHRWSQVFVLNPKAIMSCTDFYQLKKPFVGLKATQLGISADLGYLPTSNVKDINMLKVSEADLKKYVTDNITEEVREVFKKNGINNPEEHIWKNVVLLKTKNKPVKGASKRDYMPQTDRAENFEKYTPNVSKLKKGGMPTFADKVKSIAQKHLKRKKVSPSVQKDYGKTYNKQEALDSAKRIVGAMRKKEMAKKKVKIKTDGFQNLDLVDFDKDADMIVDNA